MHFFPSTWSGRALALVALLYVWVFFNFSLYKKDRVIVWDAFEYYLYLPATFVHHNYQLDWAMPELHSIGDPVGWDFRSPTGKPVGRMSMGLALTYTPFFLLGHGAAHLLGYPATGFSPPYYFFMLLGTLVYVLLANLLLRKLLTRFYSDVHVAVTLLLLNLGTNLFFYVVSDPLMTHGANFFLFTCFLYATVRWYERPVLRYALLLGFSAGLMVLTRPTNTVLGLAFVFWGINGFNDFVQRIQFWKQHLPHLLLAGVCAFAVFIPQMAYWKLQTGQWYYYSYGRLGAFYFGSPHLWQCLAGFRKGWLLYTPLMAGALVGLFWLRSCARPAFLAVLVLLPLHFYVVSSFWCWWYGAGFGLRPMIDLYPLLAFALAAAVARVWQLRLRWIPATAAVLLVLLNQVQAYQTKKNILHYDSVTRAYYFATFLLLHYDGQYDHLLKAPDYTRALENTEEY